MIVSTSKFKENYQIENPALHNYRDLRTRDNSTNLYYILFIYILMTSNIAGASWFFSYAVSLNFGFWWNGSVFAFAIIIMGACQHQLGGAGHEAAHYMLFKNRKFNELMSDWFCMFPLYTTTYQFRVHHLAHHQFVNDPDRDPDISQLKDSGHWLDFPIDHITFLRQLLKQLWLPNLIRYTLTRARYNSLGDLKNPYFLSDYSFSKWPNYVWITYAVTVPFIQTALIRNDSVHITIFAMLFFWILAIGILYLIPEYRYPSACIKPVIFHRITAISRVSYLAILYAGLAWAEVLTGKPISAYYGLFWIVPLFTTFPLFMILRQWVQHGNGDRGRLTNTRVFIVNPFLRFAVFPFGMDYHLPHHMYASVPHYKLKELHQRLSENPEYVEQGLEVYGYVRLLRKSDIPPSILDVLGNFRSPNESSQIYIDNHALFDAELISPSSKMVQENKTRARKC